MKGFPADSESLPTFVCEKGGAELSIKWPLFFILALALVVSYVFRTTLEGAPAGRTIAVDMANIEFRPTKIRIRPGDRIRFVNKDPFRHSVFLVNAANPNAVVLPDTKVEGKATFLTPPIGTKGVFTLFCTIHGGMKAKVSTTGGFEITEKMRLAAAGALPPEVKEGEALFWGKAQCSQCHSIGKRGGKMRGPNLEDIGLRAESRAKDRGFEPGTGYLVESLLEPGGYVVPGFVDDMEKVYQRPLRLPREDLVRLVAYLQSQSGKVDLWAIDIPQAKLDRPSPPDFPVKGDPEEGREFFFEEAECIKCHRVGDKKGGLGPELTRIGAYRDQAFFLREILNPSAVVSPGFQGIQLTLKQKRGEKAENITGVLAKETPEAYVVKLSDESTRTFRKSSIAKVTKQLESTMPNYAEILSARQFADIVAFLQSLK